MTRPSAGRGWAVVAAALGRRRVRMWAITAAAVTAACVAELSTSLAGSERAAAVTVSCVGVMVLDVAAGVVARGVRAAWRTRRGAATAQAGRRRG